MKVLRRALIVLIVGLACGPVAAQSSPPRFDVAPPGTIVKQLTVYLTGEAMNGKYLAVASRTQLAPAKGSVPAQYQPYLTIYAQNDANGASLYTRIYQSPGAGDKLGVLQKATNPNGSPLYYPFQELTLVGGAELMQPAVQQLVVATHAAAADCGGATVYALGITGGKLVAQLKVTNPCALGATIVAPKTANGLATLSFAGPYYNATAALCCPTKPRAVATVKWNGSKWTMTPNYFKLVAANAPAH